ncbi:TonB-dependent receptor [Janthinobacterium sp. P210006]|uniref:TonB-dependent receptor n=1 Tax=Janthinobacterium sp. P210006 TaxID=3112939 RepID=UPI002E276DE4|nr:TonB-dependent siderophore receptor [Janthinobacterium sp. P210006]
MTLKDQAGAAKPAAIIRSRKHQTAAAPRMHGTALAAFATLAMPLALHAQTVDKPQQLQEVKVVGTADRLIQAPVKSANDKLTAPLLDTPKSVTVIPAEIISQTGAVSLTDALRTVPGITIGAGEGGNPVGDNLFIRGYNAQTDTYIDGIRDTGSQSREIFALEQIEVVKGPNSAYGGRSSAGGGVNLISKTPKAEDFTNATVGLGSAKYRRATADVNRVISDDVAVRLNVMAHDAHVAGRDYINGDRWGIAPSITFGLKSATQATLSYYHMQSSELPDTGLPFNNPFSSGANVSKNGNGTPVNVPRETFYGLVNRDFRDTQSDIGTIDVRHDFGNKLILRNVTRYGKTSNDYVWTQPDDSKGNTMLYGTVWRRANTRTTDTDALANATSLGGEFLAGGVKHTYTVGLEISREETDRSSYLFSPGTNNPLEKVGTNCPTYGAATLYNCAPLLNPNANDPWVYTRTVSPARTNIVTNTRSVYGFDTIEFTPQWLLNVGIRWDDYKSSLNTPQYTLDGKTTAATSANVHATFASYQAGFVYKPSTNSSVYVSYGTSSTPPGNDGGDGIDGLTVAIQNLKPQESKSFELGTKWEVLPGGRLSVSGAYFQSDMSNARVTAPDGSTQNVGDKQVKGIELGLSGNITKEWSVFGGYTHLNAIVENNGYVTNGVINGVTQYAPSPYNGNQFPTTPKNSASLWTSYLVTPAITVGGGVNYVDKVYANVANNKYAPAYTRFDAMASYVVNRNVTLQLNIQNLTNKLYFDKVSSPHYAGVAPGRSATLTANMKF